MKLGGSCKVHHTGSVIAVKLGVNLVLLNLEPKSIKYILQFIPSISILRSDCPYKNVIYGGVAFCWRVLILGQQQHICKLLLISTLVKTKKINRNFLEKDTRKK